MDAFEFARYGRYECPTEIEDWMRWRSCKGRSCKLWIEWTLSSVNRINGAVSQATPRFGRDGRAHPDETTFQQD